MSPFYYVFGNLSVLSIYSEVLELGEKARDVKVRPQDPATFLIYHVDREDYNRKDRFILDVDSKMYMDKVKEEENENYCMIVSVYNQECPLHNKPGNVKVIVCFF